jgi:nucleoside-diphosphate-sugar epimerase
MRKDILLEDGRQSLRTLSMEYFENKVVLLTGASGLVGSNILMGLYHCLKERNVNMKVYATAHHSLPEQLAELSKDCTITFLQGDLADKNFLAELPHSDIIIHAATYAQPQRFTADPEHTLRLSTYSLFELLEKVNKDGKFLFVSSSEIYSGLTSPPFSEEQIGTTNVLHPRACYIEGKRCGEAICNAYRLKSVDAKSVRLSLAYGPGVGRNDTRVMHSLIEKGLREHRIKLMDAGVAKRTFCYISDAVQMMWKVLLQGKESLYNIGGISTVTIGELAQKIGDILNVPVEIPAEHNNGLAGAPLDVRVNMRKFNEEFGSCEYIPFEIGLQRTIDWHRGL